tara:strand:- start:24013 stop:24951 length:939 start_codon:yes stop_codon:yes gene_type:complete
MMNPDPQTGGLFSFLNRMRRPNQTTGLNPLQNFAQALDPLILPSMRGGEAIREQGAARVLASNKNKTKEFLASQPNGQLFAQALDMGVPIGEVYRAFLADQRGDVVVVGNSLVDRKTREVLFTAPSSGMGGGFTYKDASGNMISLDLGKMNDSQSQSMAYGSRMQLANNILANTENVGTELDQQFFSKIPIFGNALTSDTYKEYEQARRNFVNAILRRESGAAIAESEFESANLQYFPQPFDTPQVIAQKRANRELAVELMLAASGANATKFAKDKADEYAKQLNPLFGTEEYNEQRKKLNEQQDSTVSEDF